MTTSYESSLSSKIHLYIENHVAMNLLIASPNVECSEELAVACRGLNV